jgi:hypothetical protein
LHPNALRRIAAVLTVAVVVVSGVALPASAAKGGKGHGRGQTISRAAKAKTHTHGKSQTKKQHGKHKIRVEKFAASGVVDSIASDSLTVIVHGGTRNVRGTTVTFAVAETTKINHDDVPAELLELQAGDHVAVNGTKTTSGFAAKHVNAESPVVEEPIDSTDGADSTDGTEGGTSDVPAAV